MTLAEFKKSYGVDTISLYPSTTGSGRLVGTVISSKGTFTTITKPPFDNTVPVFVYPTEMEESGETIIVLSNKEPKAPTMIL